ncbi:MAG: outer membrane beta-barrel protein [Bryobacterales bacterium]|nr:outer membrane beta-barrel protein [Bryobacterales bacterium]
MNRFCCPVLLSLLAVASAGAQTLEVAPIAGWTRVSRAPLGYASAVQGKDSDTTFRNGYTYGLRITLNTPGYYGHELTALQTEARLATVFQDTETAPRVPKTGRVLLHQLSYNFLAYWMPKNERFRPFLTVGLEARRSGKPHIEGWRKEPTLNYGVNYGGGIKIRLHKRALVRVDLRDTFTGKPYKLQFADLMNSHGYVRQQQATLGIGLTF